MPLTVVVTDLQTDLDIRLSVRRKPECSATDLEVSEMAGRSLPSNKAVTASESPDGLISAMSTQGIQFKNAGALAQKYLSNKADFQYGIHYENETGDYRVGHSPVTIEGDDLVINYEGKVKKFKGTEGLWRLLTQDMNYFDEEEYFSQEDWETYMKILLITNQELAVRSPEEIPRKELLSARGERIQISVFCREAHYVKEIDELLRRLVDLRKVGLANKMYCGYTQSCLLFWITQRIIGTIGALGDKMDKLLEWTKLNKKLIEESELLDLVVTSLPFGYNQKMNPICDPKSLGGSTVHDKNTKGPDTSRCEAHDKLYMHYLAGDKKLEVDAQFGLSNLQSIFISDPRYFEKFEISDKITGEKLNAALEKGFYFLQSYYS